MPERRVVALIAAVLVAGAAAAFFLLSGGDDDETVDPPGLAGTGVVAGNAADYFDDGSDTLLYKSGTTLFEKPVDGKERDLGLLDATGVFPSPGSPWLAYYEPASKKTDETVLKLLDTETDDEIDLPNALGPVWSPDGTRLAYLEPANPDRCGSLARCGSKLGVYTWSPGGAEPAEIAEPGDWTILGWSGSTVLLAEGGEGATAITAVASDGRDEELDLAPHELIAPSPDGRWLLVRGEEGGATLLSTGSSGDVEIELPGFDLTDAVWTHDSESVVAVAYPEGAAEQPKKNKKKDKKEKRAELAQLVRFSPDEPFPQFFEESYGVFGDVMWAPGNDYVGFGRRLGGTLPEFVYCPVAEGDCISLMAYGEGTFPLRLQ